MDGANLSLLPDGWKLHYLGRQKPTGWWIAQLEFEGKDDPWYYGTTFISRTGLTAETALSEAISVLNLPLNP